MQRLVTYVTQDPHGGTHVVAYTTVYTPDQADEALEHCKRNHPEAIGYRVMDGKEPLPS